MCAEPANGRGPQLDDKCARIVDAVAFRRPALGYAAESLSPAILERLANYKRFDALKPHESSPGLRAPAHA